MKNKIVFVYVVVKKCPHQSWTVTSVGYSGLDVETTINLSIRLYSGLFDVKLKYLNLRPF